MKNGFEAEAGRPVEGAKDMVRKTICIDEEVLKRGLERAAAEDRSFSNYLAWLIRRDADAKTPEAVNG